MTKRKYKQGSLITTFCQLEEELKHGKVVYFNHKPISPGWIISMTFRTIQGFMKREQLRIAERIGEHQ